MSPITVEAIVAQERAQDEARAFRRYIAERLHVAQHEVMATHLRAAEIVPELLTCDDCGEPLAPWPVTT